MKSAMFMKKGLVEVQDVDKPTVKNPDDVVIKVLRACVCGSDLWAYRGLDDKPANSINSGHEAIGIVEEVGADITTVKPGDFVIAPFTHGCGHCPACLAGFDGVCQDHSDNFSNGTQAEYYLAQHAQWSLVKVPGKPEDYSEAMLKSFLTLADVMATGYHAARVADVKPGDTVVVMGDGAVGLSAIIAAKLRGAKRIISTSRHDDRRELAAEFGATDNVAERGDEAVEKILAMTNGERRGRRRPRMRGDRSIDRHRHEGGSSGRHRWPGWFATRRYHGHGHAVLPQHRRCWGPSLRYHLRQGPALKGRLGW